MAAFGNTKVSLACDSGAVTISGNCNTTRGCKPLRLFNACRIRSDPDVPPASNIEQLSSDAEKETLRLRPVRVAGGLPTREK